MLKFRSNLNLLAVKLTLNIYFHDSNLLPSPIWDIFPRIPGRAWCNCGTVIRLIRLGVLRHTVRTQEGQKKEDPMPVQFVVRWIHPPSCMPACGMWHASHVASLASLLFLMLSFLCCGTLLRRVGRWKVKKCWNLVFETKHTEEWVVLYCTVRCTVL